MAAVWRQGPRNHAALAEAGRRAMGAAAAPAAAAAAAPPKKKGDGKDVVAAVSALLGLASN